MVVETAITIGLDQKVAIAYSLLHVSFADEITWDALPADGTLRKLFGTLRLRELGWHRARSLP